MRRALALTALVLLVAACGRKGSLQPADGQLPTTPVFASQPPTPDAMLEPPTQAAPERVDDPIKRSEERREDRFDLPPPGGR